MMPPGARPWVWRGLGVACLSGGAALALFLLLARSGPAVGTAPVPRRPRSVVLVTVDTTRADHLQPYGAKDVRTPTLEKLAREGVLFERAYAVAPITLPAHTSLLTGLYPPQHGVRNNGMHYVPPEVVTLAEHLSPHGYRTAAFVSAAVLDKRYGLDQGFELYDDDLSRGHNRQARLVPDRPAAQTVEAARRWLDGLAPKDRFFLWVHLYDPHAAYSPPPPYRDEYRERLYDGEIAYMDAQIGRLLEHPRVATTRDLLVTVIGDHGESLGEHGEDTHGVLAYDATLRIPWILRLDGGPAGLRLAQPVSQVDLVPTLLDLVGLRGAGLAGQSVTPSLEGIEDPAAATRDLYSEAYLAHYTYGWEKLRILRRGRWKLLDAPAAELFDLVRDPGELSDQSGQQPGMTHDLERDLADMRRRFGDAEREAALALDADAAERLRSLGYLAVARTIAPAAARPNPRDLISLHVGLERARRLSEDRLWDAAIQELRSVLERDPNNLAALVDLAENLQNEGQGEEAIRVTERALALDPANPRLHVVLSALEAGRGRHDRALALVDEALRLDARSVEARVQKARLAAQLGRRQQAAEILEEALRGLPDEPRLLTAQAQLVELPRNPSGAEARLRRALARDPFLVEAWLSLGDVLERTERLFEASKTYAEGLKREPDNVSLHARAGLLLARTGGGAETAVHLQEALRLSPSFRADLHVALGAWLAEHGRLTEALAEYQKVLAVEPRHPGARNNRAVAYYRSGNMELAKAEFRRVLADFPRQCDARNNLAAMAVDEQDWKAAERYAREALAIDDKLPEAWNNLGLALEGKNRLAEGLASYDRALALQATYWQARYNRGVVLEKMGRRAEAIQALEEVVRQVPAYAGSHFELGKLYAVSAPDRARAHLNAFLRAAPGDDRVGEAQRRLTALR